MNPDDWKVFARYTLAWTEKERDIHNALRAYADLENLPFAKAVKQILWLWFESGGQFGSSNDLESRVAALEEQVRQLQEQLPPQ